MSTSIQHPNPIIFTTSTLNHPPVDSSSASLGTSITEALQTDFKGAVGVNFHFTVASDGDFLELRRKLDKDNTTPSKLLQEVFFDTEDQKLIKDSAWLKAVYEVDLVTNKETFLYYNLKIAVNKTLGAHIGHSLNFYEIFEEQEIEKRLQARFGVGLKDLLPIQLHRLVRWKTTLEPSPSLSFAVQLDSLHMADDEYYDVGTIRIRHNKDQSVELDEVLDALDDLVLLGLRDFQISRTPAPSKFCAQAFSDVRNGFTLPDKKAWVAKEDEVLPKPSSAQFEHFIQCYSDEHPDA